MRFYSTRGKRDDTTALSEALLQGLAADGGLYMPEQVPAVGDFTQGSFVEIAQQLAQAWFGEDVDAAVLQQIIAEAYDFAPEFRQLSDELTVCELFHGPTLSFKDFAAQFLLRLLDHILQQRGERALVLTATSGDTGSAVAAAAHGRSNIDAVILYPQGRISRLQEQQIATWGDNVRAVRVHGTFDDCQALVKSTLGAAVPDGVHLTSANSINVGRLLPQTFYYCYAALRCAGSPAVVVPSGNFGNVTAAALSKGMGASLGPLIAGTNDNDTVPRYLASGDYAPQPTQATISNAMDVSVPSNFERLRHMYNDDLATMRASLRSYSVSEAQTREMMRSTYNQYGYLADPHTAVALHTAEQYRAQHGGAVMVMSTAHPAKFPETVQEATGQTPSVPESLRERMDLPLQAYDLMGVSESSLRDYLQVAGLLL